MGREPGVFVIPGQAPVWLGPFPWPLGPYISRMVSGNIPHRIDWPTSRQGVYVREDPKKSLVLGWDP